MSPSPTVICAGVLVADLFVPPLSRLPEPGALLVTDGFLLDTGGCAANTATCLARLGVEVSVAGRVGDDTFGDFVERDLRRKGVGLAGLTRSARRGTAQTVILPVTGEDRRYIHTIGANADFCARDIDRALLAQATIVYVGGYFVLPSMAQSELADVLRFARAQGVRTVLDVVAPAGLASLSLAAIGEVLPYVDVFLPNAEEARALSGETEAHRQAACFLDAGCGTAIVTRGSLGALLMNAEQTIEAPAAEMGAVDASGAGDAFAAGFIIGLLEGWSLPDTLCFASVVGASACTQLGCTTGVFTRAQAAAFLHAHPMSLSVSDTPGRAADLKHV